MNFSIINTILFTLSLYNVLGLHRTGECYAEEGLS